MKKEYLKYNDLEFSNEDSFIAWVKNNEYDQEWKAWISEHPQMGTTVSKARSLVEDISFKTFQLDGKSKVDLWNRIDQATESAAVKPKSRRVFMLTSIAAAAVILFLLYAIFLRPSNSIDIITDIGGQEIVSLPDNSTIKLNAVSRVQFDKGNFEKNRSLRLEGEAFFNVEKGSTFTVLTDQGSVQVLGTSFNVYTRHDSLAVACYTGRVKVNNGSKEVILNAGESVTLSEMDTELTKKDFEVKTDDPSWTRGMFTFEDQKLEVVFEELARQYDINIEYRDDSIKDIKVGSAFFESGSLDKALEEVTYPYALSYTINRSTVVISK